MRSQPVEFLEWVEHDLNYAMDFYESWLTDGADPKKHRFFRRALIPRTYFGIYFAVEPDITTVVAVLDLRQDPRVLHALVNLRMIRRWAGNRVSSQKLISVDNL